MPGIPGRSHLTAPASLTTVHGVLAGVDMTFRTLEQITTLPAPFDREQATVRRERWLAASKGDPDTRDLSHELSHDSTGSALLDAVFGNSPYLARCLVRHPAIVSVWATDGPEASVLSAVEGLVPDVDERTVMRQLRRSRAMSAVAVALSDIAGLWTWQEVTASLSRFADTACRTAVNHLLLRLASGMGRGAVGLDDPARGSGFIVLGLGKLGGHELNYSSDIDLIVLWDDDRFMHFGNDPLSVSVRLTRNFVKLLQDRTADGFAFRTDLRLRPDPGATPLAMSVDSAELYYESLGRNWERSAMIKARPIAGDLEAGKTFLDRLRPFVWRRHLDFEAIRDIHAIRRKIHAVRGGSVVKIPGHDLKLGRGGIREIEFLVQAQQLIFGGRNPGLRRRATREALDALHEAQFIDRSARDDLKNAYGELRRIEHRLQMIDNAQTHEVPSTEDGLDHIATFLGHGSRSEFEGNLDAILRSVETHYVNFFEETGEDVPAMPAPGGSGGEFESLLGRMGFADSARIAALVDTWRDGQVRALRHERSRELVEGLLSRILAVFSATGEPDAALLNFHGFLGRLPAGVRFFSLLERQPRLLDLVAEIMALAPRLACELGASPVLLDYALSREFPEPMPKMALLEKELAAVLDEAEHEEDLLDRVRRWFHDREFRLAVHLVRGSADARQTSQCLSDLRDVIVRQLLVRVAELFQMRHGRLPRSAVAVVATGRYGAREPKFGSVLDLAIIHHHDRPDLHSDGPRPLGAESWVIRLVQRLMAALTVTTNAGPLFDIRLDLVSPGTGGARTSSLERLHRLREHDADQRDLLTLASARVVAATGSLAERTEETITGVLAVPRNPAVLAEAIVDRRLRLVEEHGEVGLLDVERAQGGMIDLELVMHFMKLTCPGAPGDPAFACDDLERARELMHGIRTVTECALGEPVRQTPRALAMLLARVAGSPDFEELKRRLTCSRDQVRRAFEHVAAQGTAARGEVP